jgi:hypothetical protein
MKINEVAVITRDEKVTPTGSMDAIIFWLHISNKSTKKLVATYGPFDNTSEVVQYAAEHQIKLPKKS